MSWLSGFDKTAVLCIEGREMNKLILILELMARILEALAQLFA